MADSFEENIFTASFAPLPMDLSRVNAAPSALKVPSQRVTSLGYGITPIDDGTPALQITTIAINAKVIVDNLYINGFTTIICGQYMKEADRKACCLLELDFWPASDELY